MYNPFDPGNLLDAAKAWGAIIKDATLDMIGIGNGNSMGGKTLSDYANDAKKSTSSGGSSAASTSTTSSTLTGNKSLLMIIGVALLAAIIARR